MPRHAIRRGLGATIVGTILYAACAAGDARADGTPPPATGATAPPTGPAPQATPLPQATPPQPAPAADAAAPEEGATTATPDPREALEYSAEEFTVVVTATREPTSTLVVPRSVIVVDAPRVVERGVTSALDSLDDRIGIWVEKRTAHTSDPVLRGLSGGNVLALVDGNTLSTFWGEGGFAGDDMYGKIDPWAVDRIEVVRGPSSVLYGSNALGGVINFLYKRSPFDYTEGGVRAGLRTYALAASATDSLRFRQEVFGASRNLRWFAGVTGWRDGDTVDGSGEVQKPTRGRGGFADLRLDARLSRTVEAGFSFQMTSNDPVYRYYRPRQDNENERYAVAGEVVISPAGPLADRLRVSAYYQDKEDVRNFYNAAGVRTQTGVALWQTTQLGVQASKQVGKHALTYGADFQSTLGESPDDEQFTVTPVGGTPSKPAPDSAWSSLGAYLQDAWDVTDRLQVTGSVRVDGFRFATDVDEAYHPPGGFDPQLDEITETTAAVVGGLQASYGFAEDARLYGGWTRGFRQFAPAYGIREHAGFGVVVPSPFLDPVTADQFELGVRKTSGTLQGEVAAYYTRFRNFQNLVAGTFQGLDWYDFNQNGVRDATETVFVTVGNGDAYVYGIEAWGQLDLALLSSGRLPEGLTFGAGFMWNYGQDETNDIPLRHTHPARALVKARYDSPGVERGWYAEVAGDVVARYDRIPPERLANDVGYLENPQDPASGKRRPYGLPGYTVWDVRVGYRIRDRLQASVGVDNVFDALYRPAHSRWDAPGRSFYATLELTW